MKRKHSQDDIPLNVDSNESSDFIAQCQRGDKKGVQRTIEQGVAAACRHGHSDLVEFLTGENALFEWDWLGFLKIACKHGHISVMSVLMNTNHLSLSNGLKVACEVGRMDMVESMIKRMEATRVDFEFEWDNGMAYACEYGHMSVVCRMIQKGATNWNWGLRGACFGGYLEVAQLMVAKGANDFNNGLWNACKMGRIELVRFMVEKGANVDDGLSDAAQAGHIDVVKFLIEKGATICPEPVFAMILPIQWLLWQHGFVNQLVATESTDVEQLIQWGMPPSGFQHPSVQARARNVWFTTLQSSLPSSFVVSIIACEILPFL